MESPANVFPPTGPNPKAVAIQSHLAHCGRSTIPPDDSAVSSACELARLWRSTCLLPVEPVMTQRVRPTNPEALTRLANVVFSHFLRHPQAGVTREGGN